MGLRLIYALWSLVGAVVLAALILRVRNGWLARRDRALWTDAHKRTR